MRLPHGNNALDIDWSPIHMQQGQINMRFSRRVAGNSDNYNFAGVFIKAGFPDFPALDGSGVPVNRAPSKKPACTAGF
jgi:hypothetical protein